MKVLITGATGMIGKLVLANCLNTERITAVISLVRKPTGISHKKLTEIVIADFENYIEHEKLFEDIGAAFFCLGAYTGQVKDDLFKKITVDYPVAFANTLSKMSPSATICLLSGAGADRTEKSKTAFARYKGMAENQIANLALQFYSFRPAYIYPVESRKEPNIGYRIIKLLYPLIKAFGKKYSIQSTQLADAMFNVGLHGAAQQILENKDILQYISIRE